MEALFRKVLSRVRPTEVQVHEVDSVVKRLNTALHVAGLQAECMVGGSFAKGTFLKGDHDVDLFVRFDLAKYIDQPISNFLEPVLGSLFEGVERIHGSRDYFQFRNDFFFEVIPVLRIADYREAKNVTDMSPFHVAYAKKHIDKKPSLADEIRLLKVFCKAANVYGAESFVQGFSGHVIDLLIIHAGSFKKLVEEASEWGDKVVIDLENHHKEPLKVLNPSKLVSPLIIVDPVQPDRNAAASVSIKSFDLFKLACRNFLINPSESFFTVSQIDWEGVKLKYPDEWFLGLKIAPLDGKKDVVGTKLLKVFDHIKANLEEHDFKLLEDGFQFDEQASLMYFVIKQELLSEKLVHQGPPLHQKDDVQKFKGKHKETFEEKGRVHAHVKRKHIVPKTLLEHLIMNKYVVERVKKVEWL